jgi:Arc/MetJ-type ribon-helix-helix transcriptional regulator
MKKPSSRIREEIARLQDQLRHAETREAERIGRVALKAGLGEIEIDETELQKAFEELTARFRRQDAKPRKPETPPITAGEAAGNAGEA